MKCCMDIHHGQPEASLNSLTTLSTSLSKYHQTWAKKRLTSWSKLCNRLRRLELLGTSCSDMRYSEDTLKSIQNKMNIWKMCTRRSCLICVLGLTHRTSIWRTYGKAWVMMNPENWTGNSLAISSDSSIQTWLPWRSSIFMRKWMPMVMVVSH